MSLNWTQVRDAPMSPADVVRACGFYRPPVDVYRIAEMLGIEVREVTSPGWSGACQYDPASGVATIWVRKEDHRLRKRFTVAHEIGHIVLHPPGVAYRDIEFEGSCEERQANEYALGLLTPGFMVAALIPFYGGDFSRLAKAFDVSTGTAEHGLIRIYG